MAEEQHDTIDDLSTELRRFPPPDGFKADALVTGTDLYDEAATTTKASGPAGRRS